MQPTAPIETESPANLKALKDELLAKAVLYKDGTVRGLHYRSAIKQRGAVLGVNIQSKGGVRRLSTMQTVDGRHFPEVYATMVNMIAENYGIESGSDLHSTMHASIDAFLAKYDLQLTEVRYLQARKLATP